MGCLGECWCEAPEVKGLFGDGVLATVVGLLGDGVLEMETAEAAAKGAWPVRGVLGVLGLDACRLGEPVAGGVWLLPRGVRGLRGS